MNAEAYAEWYIDSTPSRVADWTGPGRLRALVGRSFQDAVEMLRNPEWAGRFAAERPSPGMSAADHGLREIGVLTDAEVLDSIRFLGGDTEKPFVGVLSQSRTIAPDELLAVSERLLDEFSGFRPRAVWWWSTAPREEVLLLLKTFEANYA